MPSKQVSINLQGTADHACNAFNTTDRGLVFVDCTGQDIATKSVPYFPTVVPYGESGGQTNTREFTETTTGWDKIAYIEIGKEYGLISLTVADDFSYDSYEGYMSEWDSYNHALDSYNANVDGYNAKANEYENLYDSCDGYATPGECHQLLSLYDDLNRQYIELDNQFDDLDAQDVELGGFYWQPLGIVEEVHIWW
jgi:hypothetical protein